MNKIKKMIILLRNNNYKININLNIDKNFKFMSLISFQQLVIYYDF